MTGHSDSAVDELITSADERELVARLTAQDVDQLDSEHRSAQDASAVADWSRPITQQHAQANQHEGRQQQRRQQQQQQQHLIISAGEGEDEEKETGNGDRDMGDLFVIDNNPDLSLLGAASPQEAESRIEDGDISLNDPSASVVADAASEPSSSSDAAAAAASSSSKTVAHHLAGPGEHVLTHGLLLPSNVILEGEDMQMQDGAREGFNGDDQDLGEYEQLDAARTGARYYEEEKEEGRPCHKCQEVGHVARDCPHTKCLKCGAMDEHVTSQCPLVVQCFRCGAVGHISRDCTQPRGARISYECDRCGSSLHRTTTCPTLWRIYSYNSREEYAAARQELHNALQRELHGRGGTFASAAGDAPVDEDEIDYGVPRRDWDPATRWCYNCGSKGNHWGDDCPMPRPTFVQHTMSRDPASGQRSIEPGIFSERISRLGPFAHELEKAPPLARRGGVGGSAAFEFEIDGGARMHLAGDPRGARGANGSSRSYGRDRDRDRERDRDRDRDRVEDYFDEHERHRNRDSNSRRERDQRGGNRRMPYEGSNRSRQRKDYYDDGDDDDNDWFEELRRAGEDRSSKRSKNVDGSSTDRHAKRRRREEDDDFDEARRGGSGSDPRGSRSGGGRDGGSSGSLVNRISKVPSKSSRDQGKSGRSRDAGANDDDNDDSDVILLGDDVDDRVLNSGMDRPNKGDIKPAEKKKKKKQKQNKKGGQKKEKGMKKETSSLGQKVGSAGGVAAVKGEPGFKLDGGKGSGRGRGGKRRKGGGRPKGEGSSSSSSSRGGSGPGTGSKGVKREASVKREAKGGGGGGIGVGVKREFKPQFGGSY